MAPIRRRGRPRHVRALRSVLLVVVVLALGVPARAGAFVYWANYRPANGTTFGRANLDGSSPDESFITAATDSIAVAVDGQHIYWTNPSVNTIGRANLDDTSAAQGFISLSGVAGPGGLAIDARHIYWTTQGPGFVAHANLGGMVDAVTINITYTPTGGSPNTKTKKVKPKRGANDPQGRPPARLLPRGTGRSRGLSGAWR